MAPERNMPFPWSHPHVPYTVGKRSSSALEAPQKLQSNHNTERVRLGKPSKKPFSACAARDAHRSPYLPASPRLRRSTGLARRYPTRSHIPFQRTYTPSYSACNMRKLAFSTIFAKNRLTLQGRARSPRFAFRPITTCRSALESPCP